MARIIECEDCGDTLEATGPRQKLCRACADSRHRVRNARNMREARSRPGTPVTYAQAWGNLAIAVVKQMCNEAGVDYEEFKQWLLEETTTKR